MTDQTTDVKQPSLDSVLKENSKLKSMLLTAKKLLEEKTKAVEGATSLNKELSTRVANIEMERRKETIATVLKGAYVDEESTAKNLESFAKSNMSVDEIKTFVTPLIELRTATVNATTEQAKQAEINTKAEELAKVKSASVHKSQPTSKVAIKNAAVPTEEVETEIPAWAVIGGGVM